MLKNGNQLSGEVLKEKADSIVLDLGFAVLTVPVEDIQERRLESQAAAELKPAGGPDHIYTEVDPRALQERPVKALADELGGSVALVQRRRRWARASRLTSGATSSRIAI